MPFYEYECSACKFYVEALQKISDPPLKKCPSCKKSTLKKLVSAPAFRLAGGGWYETDFKSDQENKRNLVGEEKEPAGGDSKPDKADAKADAKAGTKDDTKADTKTAAETKAEKPEAKPSTSKKSTVRAKTKAPAKKK